MSTSASRLLAPAILVLLVAGIIAAAILGNDSDDADAAPRTTTSTTRPGDGDDEDEDDAAAPADCTTSGADGDSDGGEACPGEDDVASTTSTTSSTTSTTAATGARATTTTTAGPVAVTTPPTTAAPTAEPGAADLAVLSSTNGDAVRFSVANYGPDPAPGITLTITGAPGPVRDTASGVSCSGEGTITCTIDATGEGGILGYVDFARGGDCPDVTATVRSDVADPVPGNDSRTRALC